MYVGEILDNKYKIVGCLGQGGTAQVLLAENITLNNLWAVKVLPKNSQWVSCLMEEVEILKRLSHPMLPRIVDLFEDQDNYYIIMDYFSGSSLTDILHKEGKIHERVLIKWTFELLDAFEYLHSRNPPVIYRDLKPSNLIVDDSGKLRLIDFGTARFHNEEKYEDTVYIGTQGYAAPEQYGNGRSDQRTDLYNLGMTLVHLAAGMHPLEMGTGKIGIYLKNAGISKEFTKFILGLVEPDPANRVQSAHVAFDVLSNISVSKAQFFRKSLKKQVQTIFKGVIGIASYLPGSGSTSFCLALGRYFTRTGRRTALVELNGSGDFNRLEKILDNLGELKIRRETSFEAGEIVFYPGVSDSGEISRKGIDIIILDLGQLNTEQKLRELNHTDLKLILCPRVPWKYPIFLEYDESIGSRTKNEWIYIASDSDSFERQIFRKRIRRMVACSFPDNPYYLTDEGQKKIERVFKEICSIADAKK